VMAQVFDGHGGRDAAVFCRDHLLAAITSQPEWTADVPAALVRTTPPGGPVTPRHPKRGTQRPSAGRMGRRVRWQTTM
jgi:hypothetical protein